MRLLGLLALCLVGCAPRMVTVPSDGFVLRDINEDGIAVRHYVYVPPRRTPGEKLPVILYLHGGGERGDDVEKVIRSGLGPVVWKTHGTFPAIVVFPQCATDAFWAEKKMSDRVFKALDATMAEFDGDPKRVYVTGNSLGGYGTWLLAARQPERFAALVPICGGVRPPRGQAIPKDSVAYDASNPSRDPAEVVTAKLGKIPVWAFHGKKDWLVPVESSRQLVALMKAQGAEVHYTEYPDAGHNSWDRAYAEPELLPWLLKQRRE